MTPRMIMRLRLPKVIERQTTPLIIKRVDGHDTRRPRAIRQVDRDVRRAGRPWPTRGRGRAAPAGSDRAGEAAAPAGQAVVATIESGTALASGYETVGTIAAGTVPGIYSVDIDVNVGRYLRSTITSSSGTAVVAANVIAKKRTLT